MLHFAQRNITFRKRNFVFFSRSNTPNHLHRKPPRSSSSLSLLSLFSPTTCNHDIPENQFALARSFAFSVASRWRRLSCPPARFPRSPPRVPLTFRAPSRHNTGLPFSHLARGGAHVLLLSFSWNPPMAARRRWQRRRFRETDLNLCEREIDNLCSCSFNNQVIEIYFILSMKRICILYNYLVMLQILWADILMHRSSK